MYKTSLNPVIQNFEDGFYLLQLLNKKEKGNSLGSIVCIGEIAAPVLSKLFINDYQRYHTTVTPLFSNKNDTQFMI